MKKLWLLMLTSLLIAGSVHSQYTPESGSAERKAIVEGLRIAVRRAVKQPVIFQVNSIQAKDGWATVSASLMKPDGSAFDWTGTKWESSWRSGEDFEGGVQALLRRQGNTWRVTDYVIDATDWSMGEACKKRGCPRALR